MSAFRALSNEEIQVLEKQGCVAADWASVQVAEGFDPKRVHEAEFGGKVNLGALKGEVAVEGGARLPAEIRNATLIDCELGDNVRISNIGSHIANYKIGSGAVISDVGVMATNSGATFGNGVELETHNEGGGREVRIFNEMSAQFAYLMAEHRYRPKMLEQFDKLIDDYVAKVKSDQGTVGDGAQVCYTREIIDVNIGPFAVVSGAARLTNGTILSEKEAPAFVGSTVIAEDFIISEGSKVDSGALLSQTFIGQGVKCGRQFSSENSMFFANCECFHSEAVAVFGGPYTVTHHRSTLLIAGMFSFYNAGSGTNQSNHMYKLGPVHQGRVERGSKTGSFSYMLWPCVVSPFSVVMGKNMANFDISEFPFSYVQGESDGSYLTPSMNMTTVGTRRDGDKWPNRDRRKSAEKRDLIRFEVFSPYVVGRMVQGEKTLLDLHKNTPKENKVVQYKGIRIKRLLMRHGAKNYAMGIDMYLNGKILERAKSGNYAVDKDAVYSAEWADVGGLLIAQDRLEQLEADIEAGKFKSIADVMGALREAWASYEKDEWAWVRKTFEERTGKSLDDLSEEDLEKLEAGRNKAKATITKKILLDAEKEFDDEARISFGVDGKDGARDRDFEAIRGTFEGNSFAQKLKGELSEIE